jgi:hypothetical protein
VTSPAPAEAGAQASCACCAASGGGILWSASWRVWLCQACRWSATERDLAGKAPVPAGSRDYPLAGVLSRLPAAPGRPLQDETGILL